MPEPGYASRGGFERVEPLGEGFIRGPARLLIAPYASKFPTEINSIINLEKSANWKTEKQKIAKTAEVAEKGTFYLGFSGYATKELKWSAKGKEAQEALEELPTIGGGGIKCFKGEAKTLGEEEWEFEFTGELEKHAQPLIEVLHNTVEKSSLVPIVVSRTVSGAGEFDPQGEWSDLGSTKGGIKITRNNTESLIDIDQIQAAISALPDEWEMTVEAPLAETSYTRLETAWEALAQPTQTPSKETGYPEGKQGLTPEEKVLGLGNPLEYVERRLAVIYKGTMGSNKGKLKAFVFRRTTRSATASSVDFMKTGNLATVNFTARVFAETSIANPKLSMGLVYAQKYF